jgi:predicted metal-dependent phosphoesterase TrpH
MTRVDLHCHSTASAVAKLDVQHALGLPECATPPEEVYALAKRRGMDFVTITDHDTIDGVLALESVLAGATRRTPVTYDDLC